MKITVKDCLSLEAFSQCIIAAGKRNLENRVRSISVMDADNVSEAIKHNGIKDQLVLTSFYGFKDQPHLQRNIIVELSSVIHFLIDIFFKLRIFDNIKFS